MTNLRSQRGAATLIIILLLLLLGALAVMSASKVVFFGQKAANNDYHYGQAFAAAQAGLQRGYSYLRYTGPQTPNRTTLISSANGLLVSSQFPIVEQLSSSRSGYSITMTQPSAATDPYLVRITSVGCGDGCAPCTTSCAPQATVTQLVRYRNLMSGAPADGLIARGSINMGGNMDVKNLTGVGVAVHAGQGINITGSASAEGGLTPNDTALANTTADAFFAYFFGDTKANVQAQLPNLTGFPPDGTTGGAYWLQGDIAVHGGTYGSPTAPVIIIVNGNLKLNGNTTIYGFVYVIGATSGWDNNGGGTAAIIGGAASETTFNATGTPDITANPGVIGALSAGVAPAFVSASWRDF